MADAQNRARDLGNSPPNVMTPSALADYAVALAARHDALSATVLDEAQIRSSGMGAFAAVAQGSDQPAKLIALSYEPPAAAGGRRLALIGKAVTFDSGGLWLKPTGQPDHDEVRHGRRRRRDRDGRGAGGAGGAGPRARR